jgi:hypothetical protein
MARRRPYISQEEHPLQKFNFSRTLILKLSSLHSVKKSISVV